VKRLAFAALMAMCLAVLYRTEQPGDLRGQGRGQVGERFDGYPALPAVRLLSSAKWTRSTLAAPIIPTLPPAVDSAPQDVGITAGCMTLGSVSVGEAYLLADNVWRRRGERQAAPVPSYCRP
jgi:hypothetical protein